MLRTRDPVDISMTGAQIEADAMSVLENGKVLVFEKRVKMNLDSGRFQGKTTAKQVARQMRQD